MALSRVGTEGVSDASIKAADLNADVITGMAAASPAAAADDDVILVYDTSASALKKMTRGNFKTAAISALNDITNVTISSIGSGELLKWNGSAWINNTLAEAGIETATIKDADNNTKIQVEESADENKIRFDTAGTERMMIDHTGKVGVGVTPAEGHLHIHTTASMTSLFVKNTNSSDYVAAFRAGGTGSTPVIAAQNSANANVFTVSADGETTLIGANKGLILNTASTSQAASITWKENGTSKFEIKKDTGNSLDFYDSGVSTSAPIIRLPGYGERGVVYIGGTQHAGRSVMKLNQANNQVTLADDAVLDIAIHGGAALIVVSTNSATTGYRQGLFFITYGVNNWGTLLYNQAGWFANSDTDGKICLYIDGYDSTIHLKNRVGASKTFSISQIGFGGQ